MITEVNVARLGTALELSIDGGRSRVVRRVDLDPVLGVAGLAAPRFTAARLVAGGVELEYAGGSERLSEASLVGGVDFDAIDLIVENTGIVLTGDGTGSDPLGLRRGWVLALGGGKIRWLGPASDLARSGLALEGVARVDARGRMVTPGLIDCHAHPVFAGNRADEFGLRAAGADYLAIAAAGGGIAATVAATRAATCEELIELTYGRASRALANGTTTLEAKSGYDLTTGGELRLLEVALAVDALQPVDLWPTLLGAHVVPAERRDDVEGFVTEVVTQMIPQAQTQRLARAVDVYCDHGAFSAADARRILTAARMAGLPVRAHVGQFADLGAAQLLAELGGLSADHLEIVSEDGIAALASAGVVAVMLPGACVQLKLPIPPVASFRAAGVPMAVATDMNPGTSLCESLTVPMWLAATHYGMTVEETWLGVTKHAARALGRHDVGVLTIGAAADLCLWEAETPAAVPYRYGSNLLWRVIKNGRLVDPC